MFCKIYFISQIIDGINEQMKSPTRILSNKEKQLRKVKSESQKKARNTMGKLVNGKDLD